MLAVFLRLFLCLFCFVLYLGPIWPHFLLILHGWLVIFVFPGHVLFVPQSGVRSLHSHWLLCLQTLATELT